MDLQKLRYFLEAVFWGSINKAAEALHVAQPSLSRQIAELEAELGQQLLIRSSSGVKPTDAGRLLYARGLDILEMVDNTTKEISGHEQKERRIVVGVTDSYIIEPCLTVLEEMITEIPELRVDYRSATDGVIAQGVQNGSIDLGMFVSIESLSDVKILELPYKIRWGLLVRKDDPIAARRAIEPKDLYDKPLFMPARQLGQHSVLKSFESGYGLSLKVIGTYDRIVSANLLAEHGIGAVVCLEGYAGWIPEDSPLTFVPLDTSSFLQVVMARSGRSAKNRSVDILWDRIRKLVYAR